MTEEDEKQFEELRKDPRIKEITTNPDGFTVVTNEFYVYSPDRNLRTNVGNLTIKVTPRDLLHAARISSNRSSGHDDYNSWATPMWPQNYNVACFIGYANALLHAVATRDWVTYINTLLLFNQSYSSNHYHVARFFKWEKVDK